jgi:hypothetical protein
MPQVMKPRLGRELLSNPQVSRGSSVIASRMSGLGFAQNLKKLGFPHGLVRRGRGVGVSDRHGLGQTG